MIENKFFSYCPTNGINFHRTREDAKKNIEDSLGAYLEEYTDGCSECGLSFIHEGLLWGEIIQHVVMEDQGNYTEKPVLKNIKPLVQVESSFIPTELQIIAASESAYGNPNGIALTNEEIIGLYQTMITAAPDCEV